MRYLDPHDPRDPGNPRTQDRAQARGHDWQATLEGLVDTHSLNDVLDALVEICHAKAEHVATNWQDATLAKAWEKAGTSLAVREALLIHISEEL